MQTAAQKTLSPFASISTQVKEASHVGKDDLLALAEGRLLAIVVLDYCPPHLCSRMAKRLTEDHRYGEYENVPGVHKWGLNTYEGLSTPEREERYFAQAVPAIQDLRANWAPYLSPIDRVRLELQEAWPSGANMATLDARKLFVGQARVFRSGNGAIPHQDFLPWELRDLRKSPQSDDRPDPTGQLTFNVYLQTPEVGGELELWNFGYDHDDYDMLRADPDSYGLSRELIAAPSAVLKPQPGMLVLFHASRLHAVRPSQGVDRIAISSFIGMRGMEPLTYWS